MSFTVVCYSVVGMIIQYLALQPRLTSTNMGIRDLRSIAIWWGSLSVVDRRTRASRTKAVSVVEEAIIRISTAWTCTTAEAGAPGEEEGAEEGGKKDEKKSKK